MQKNSSKNSKIMAYTFSQTITNSMIVLVLSVSLPLHAQQAITTSGSASQVLARVDQISQVRTTLIQTLNANISQIDNSILQLEGDVSNSNLDSTEKAKLFRSLDKAKQVNFNKFSSVDDLFQIKKIYLQQFKKDLSILDFNNVSEAATPDPTQKIVGDVLVKSLELDSNFIYKFIKLTGVLKTDYTAINNKLHEDNPYLTTDQLADKIIKTTVISSSLLTAAVSSVTLLDLFAPGAGTAASILAIPTDLINTFRTQAALVLQLVDLYNIELDDTQKEATLTTILALGALGLKMGDQLVVSSARLFQQVKAGQFLKNNIEVLPKLFQVLSKFQLKNVLTKAAPETVEQIAEQTGIKIMPKVTAGKLSVFSIVANTTLTAATTYGMGKMAQSFLASMRLDQRVSSLNAMNVSWVRDGVFKLLIQDVIRSNNALKTISLEDRTDGKMRLISNLMKRANITKEGNPQAYARIAAEAQNFNTIPAYYVEALGKLDQYFRMAIADVLMQLQLADGDRNPEEVAYFAQVRSKILGLEGRSFDIRYMNLEAWINGNHISVDELKFIP